MKLWLIDPNQTRRLVIDPFSPAFYVSGKTEAVYRLQNALRGQENHLASSFTERTDIWDGKPRRVLEITVKHPTAYRAWVRWVHKFNPRLRLYNSDLMLASLYCWQKKVFPLAQVEIDVDEQGWVRALECHDNQWTLDYELPPFEIMQVRLGGLSRIDPRHGRQTALEILC